MKAENSHLVLARKYRPQTLDELVGQDHLVRVLRNSFRLGKIAHGYILTGVRGVGKTTTARIIAKTLNCDNNKDQDKKNIIGDPCGTCDQCQAITDYRHVDVQEMDAASHNRVDDVRAIIDSAGYRSVMGPYRVYILDEAHMITQAAFNALLKTLEEPPPNLIFILATTEIQKIPATILSRCVRFDLQRVASDVLEKHFKNILQKETITISDGAIAIIARAAEGSVRDGLSMLDQAMTTNPDGITEADVLAMLGLSDLTLVYQLFHSLMAGDAKKTIDQYHDLITKGGAPDIILEQLMTAVHLITKLKLDPTYHSSGNLIEAEKKAAEELAPKISLPDLAMAWQMLLKGLTEVKFAPDPIIATEMILIRLMLLDDTPDDGVKKNNSAEKTDENNNESNLPPKNNDDINFADMVNMIKSDNMQLAVLLASEMRIVEFYFPKKNNNIADDGGRLIFTQSDSIRDDDIAKLKKHLTAITGTVWQVQTSDKIGEATLDEQLYKKIINHHIVKKTINLFPKARLINPKLKIEK